MLAQPAWKKQNSLLSEEATNLSVLKKQITKQSEIDATVQTSISHKINSLKEHAAALAIKLENEKHKNVKLEFIIKNVRKGTQTDPNSSRQGEDGIPFLQNRAKKLEYDLGQLNSKANRMAEWVQEKRHRITQNRMERVIDSGIFRNIEIQLIDAELRFKKLLLEKVVRQMEYEKEVKNYAQLKQESQNNVPDKEKKDPKQEKLKIKYKNIEKSQDSFNIEALILRKSCPEKRYNLLNNRKSILPGSISFIDDEAQYQNQHKSLIIRKLLIETGLPNQQQLVQHFFNIDGLTERVYNKMNLTITQCNQIEAYLENANSRRNQKKIECQKKQKKIDRNNSLKAELRKTKSAIEAIQQQNNLLTEQINAFFNQTHLQQLMSKLLPTQQYIPDLTEPQIQQFQSQLKALQKNVLQLLKKQDKGTATLQAGVSDRSKSNDKLQELIIKAKTSDEISKVMKREEFQEQYHKIIKNSSKNKLLRKEVKRKSNASLHR